MNENIGKKFDTIVPPFKSVVPDFKPNTGAFKSTFEQTNQLAAIEEKINTLSEVEFKKNFPIDGFGWFNGLPPNGIPDAAYRRSEAIKARWKHIDPTLNFDVKIPPEYLEK